MASLQKLCTAKNGDASPARHATKADSFHHISPENTVQRGEAWVDDAHQGVRRKDWGPLMRKLARKDSMDARIDVVLQQSKSRIRVEESSRKSPPR